MFVEPNDKGAYCAHRSSRDVDVFMDIDAFMDMPQLKVTQIWDMRLNGYSGYWPLKALKSVTATLYKLRPGAPAITTIAFVHYSVVVPSQALSVAPTSDLPTRKLLFVLYQALTIG